MICVLYNQILFVLLEGQRERTRRINQSNKMNTLRIENLKIKSGKSAYAGLETTKNAIERINARIESGRELTSKMENEYNLIQFCIESGKAISPDALECAMNFVRDDYNEGLQMAKEGMN